MLFPKQTYDRGSQKAGNRTHITDRVRDIVMERSEGFCERCGRWAIHYGGQMAHLESAGQYGRGDIEWNIVLLCGPSVNTGTCHNFADYTAEGYEWRREKRAELVIQYNVQICTAPLCKEETNVLDAYGDPICKSCADLYPERMKADR